MVERATLAGANVWVREDRDLRGSVRMTNRDSQCAFIRRAAPAIGSPPLLSFIVPPGMRYDALRRHGARSKSAM